jgi:polyhydroxyalkanoate synthase
MFFGVDRYDNPATIRLKKYPTGTPLVLARTAAATGQTAKEVVWTQDKVKLYHYEPMTARQFPIPVLLVYALILRPYILDLIPGNSFVEYLLAAGFGVYLLDWGVPDTTDQQRSLELYILAYMPAAMASILRTSQATELTLFGYCMGGTMSTIYAALFPGKPLKNLVLLATPIDFAPARLSAWSLVTKTT